MVAAQSLQIPVAEYAPRSVKQAVTGKGDVSKEQVAKIMQMHLGLRTPIKPLDASDALALAYCHWMQAVSFKP